MHIHDKVLRKKRYVIFFRKGIERKKKYGLCVGIVCNRFNSTMKVHKTSHLQLQ